MCAHFCYKSWHTYHAVNTQEISHSSTLGELWDADSAYWEEKWPPNWNHTVLVKLFFPSWATQDHDFPNPMMIQTILTDPLSLLHVNHSGTRSFGLPWPLNLLSNDAIWRWVFWSTLVQVMACCLTAPSHYLNLQWLIISEVQWQSPDSNLPQSLMSPLNTQNTMYGAFIQRILKKKCCVIKGSHCKGPHM